MPPIRSEAILIAVSEGPDGEPIGPEYAAADVRAMREVLKRLGANRKDLSALVGKSATRPAIESRLRAALARAAALPSSLTLYFAGPAFSVGGRNYLATRDTAMDDPEATSIDLDHLLREIAGNTLSRIQIYLDCGQPGSTVDLGTGPDAVLPLSEKSVEKALVGAEHVALFSASRLNQASYSSPVLKRGIWTHHLIEALSGKVPEILGEGGVLYTPALQRHLAEHVPLTLRDTYTDRRKNQTPWFAGKPQADFRIADLSPISRRTSKTATALAAVVKDFAFTREERVRVKTLSGFKQGIHHAPKWTSRQAEEFVGRLALGEIEEDLAAKFAEIRRYVGYQRRQINIHPPGEGNASIRTPDFQYTVSVGLDEDPAMVVLTRELSDIHRPETLANDGMALTFNDAFDTVRLTFDRPIAIEDLIDLAEGHALQVAYPPDCSSCTIRAEDGAIIRVAGSHLILKYSSCQTLERLTRGIGQIMHMFPKLDALPSPANGRG